MSRPALHRGLLPACVVLACAASAAGAQSAGETLSLEAAELRAQKERPLLAAQEERVEAARARIRQSRAGLMPRLEVEGTATDGPLGAPPLGLGGVTGTPIKKHTGGSLNLLLTVFDWGRTANRVRAGKAEVLASQEQLAATRLRVRLEVRQAFLAALEAIQRLETGRRIQRQREQMARQARARVENGLASRVEQDLAEVGVSEAHLAIVEAEAAQARAYAALSTSIGAPVAPGTPLLDPVAVTGELLAPQPPAAPILPNVEEAYQTALQARPEMKRSLAEISALQAMESAARAGRRPQLFGVGSVGKVNAVPLFEPGDKPWAVGIALRVPIFTGGLVEGQVEEARRNVKSSQALRQELANQIREQVTGAVANLRAASQALDVAHVQLRAARDALSLATQRYEAQLGSIVELGQAQAAEATASFEWLRARYEREAALAVLSYALGEGSPAAPARGKAP